MRDDERIMTASRLSGDGKDFARPINQQAAAHSDQMVSLDPIWLTTSELARRWRMAPRTLERWRASAAGPARHYIGGRVLYLLSDVLGYEGSQRRKSG